MRVLGRARRSLRGSADRRVANVSIGSLSTIRSLGELANMKSSEPIRASSKLAF
jgi:hypothetical protein